MLLLLSQTLCANNNIDCFQPTQILYGYASTQSLELILEPHENVPETCKAFAAGTAKVTLDIMGVTFATYNESLTSDSVLLDMTKKQLVFSFNITVTDQVQTLFDSILQATQAQFTIYFLESLPVQQTIQQLIFQTLDSTNCWTDTTIQYDMEVSNPFINITAKPLFCSISQNVQISIHYLQDGVWNQVPIEPHPSLANGYVNNANYVHLSTFFFYQDYNTQLTEEAKKDMEKMFSVFRDNRSTQFKLVLITTVSGIQSEFYSQASNLFGIKSNCFSSFSVQQMQQNISLRAGLYDTLSPDCNFVSDTINVTILLQREETVFVEETNENEIQTVNFQHSHELPSDYFLTTKTTSIMLENLWPTNLTVIKWSLFITYLSNKNIVTEMTYFGETQKTCYDHIILSLSEDGACIDAWILTIEYNTTNPQTGVITTNDICYDRFKVDQDMSLQVTVIDEEDQRKRDVYFNFYGKFPAVKNETQKFLHFCIDKSQEKPEEATITNSYFKRVEQFIEKTHVINRQNVRVAFQSNIEHYQIYTFGMEAPRIAYVYVMVPVVVSVIAVAISVYMFVKQR